jgi:hypothetical protein
MTENFFKDSEICGKLAVSRLADTGGLLSEPHVTEPIGLVALSAMSTLIASLVGTCVAMFFAGPLSLIALLFFPMFLGGLVLAAVLAAPVTCFLFPLAYQLLRYFPLSAQLAIPVVGFLGGGAIIWIWIWIAAGILPQGDLSRELFSAVGMVAGLSAGAFYSRGLYA